MEAVLTEGLDSSSGVGPLLAGVLAALSNRDPTALQEAYPRLATLVGATAEEALEPLIPAGLAVRGSAGFSSGQPAKVPWIAITPTEAGGSASEGLYLVYLFAVDGSRAYLSLNQGTEGLNVSVIEARTARLRNSHPAPDGFGVDMDLGDFTGRPRKYIAGSIWARCYERESLPVEEELEADLEAAVDALLTATGSRRRPPSRYWLFQGNIRVWPEMNEYFERLDGEGEWSVRRHGDDMAPGDLVAFWSAGPDGGVVALGELTSRVFERPQPAWRESDDPTETAVRFQLTARLDPEVARWECQQDEVLGDLPVLRFPQGTNYPLTGEMWERITTMAQPMHVLLKWAEQPTTEAVELHREVADAQGSVVWGKFGAPLSDQRVAILHDQVVAGTPTYAFLLGPPARPTLWRARIVGVTNDGNAAEVARIPGYYRTDLDSVGTYFTLDEFEELDRADIDRSLMLRSKPDGLVSESIRGQTTVLYVNERAGDDEDRETSAADLRTTGTDPLSELVKWTLLEQGLLEQMLDSLESGQPQIVLTGPPGTGKTWVAQALANHLLGRPLDEPDGDRVHLVQFHPSYGYEEFVEGLRPVPAGDHGLRFELEAGVIRTMAEAIAADGLDRVLIIDEMNRANLPRVFGELMFLLEYRSKSMQLMNGESFALPPGLRIIGTMNTADRSVRSIDIALRRRFDFFELLADPAVLRRYYDQPGRTTSVPGLFEGFERLNSWLRKLHDRHQEVGHTFFFPRDGVGDFDPAQLQRVWDRKVFPLIEEYFFDQPDQLEECRLDGFWTA